MKIAFVLAVHLPDDDRVWYQQAAALRKAGHEVAVVSAKTEHADSQNVYCFDNKKHFTTRKLTMTKFAEFLKQIQPDTIICDNPVSILAAREYKKESKKKSIKIYYDITEFYPSKIHLYYNSFFKNLLKYCLLYCVSIYVGFLVDGFIFGEYYKAKRYKKWFFWQRSVNLSYFASLEHVRKFPEKYIKQECNIFYAGDLTLRAGYYDCLFSAIKCAKMFPKTKLALNIVTKSAMLECFFLTELPPNLKVKIQKFLPFKEFCQTFGKSDIFLDLRAPDAENTRCLPIKLFYYMAAGRPVIYSDLNAIRREVPEIQEFGFLLNKKNTNKIAEKIACYINNPQLYTQHCTRAGELAETKYNWAKIEKSFVEFIENE
ncbi:MAG: hypothetical protein LBS01_08905 [Prevotellaceae bacterium]|jgi:glycosyltransferase involved in cell wall biosynthesis|nr:hypothetical protein [Prevotellaceae bacterium]